MITEAQLTLDEYAKTFIRLKARQLVGKYGFTKSDHEDLEQELALDLLVHLERFDPGKGQPATFVRLVVDRCAASLVRKRTSLARDFRRARHSLEELGDEVGHGNLAEPAYDDRDQRDLTIDVTEALRTLPDGLRSIAMGLRDGGTLLGLARKHRCDQQAMRRRVEQIRAHFAQRGLEKYVSAHRIGAAPRK